MTQHVLTLAQFCSLLPTLGTRVWRHEMIHLLMDPKDGRPKAATFISAEASRVYGLNFHPVEQKEGYAIAITADDQEIVEFILGLN